MSIGMTVAFVLYALATAPLAILGAIYVVRTEPMPYHRKALGEHRFEDQPQPVQVLMEVSLGLLGGMMLATALALFLLLAFPFRAGELWARLAVPAIALLAALSTLRATWTVKRRTEGNPPMGVAMTSFALIGAGFVASWF